MSVTSNINFAGFVFVILNLSSIIERLKAGPGRGVSVRAGKWTARAWSKGVIVQKRKKFYVFFCISGHSEHFLFLTEKS